MREHTQAQAATNGHRFTPDGEAAARLLAGAVVTAERDRAPATGLPRSAEGARSPTARSALLVIAGSACVVAPAATLVDAAPSSLRLAAALVLFCFAPGAALLAQVGPRAGPREAGLVLATSLSLVAIAAQAMLWLHAWEPAAATCIVAALCLPAIAAPLARRTIRGAGMPRARLRRGSAGAARRAGLHWTPGATTAHMAVIAIALACWATALPRTELSQLSGYGLLAALPPRYFVALVILAAGFAVAASPRRTKPLLLAAYAVALVAILYATAPILYDEPRYTWTYRHLGVIDYIAAHGAIDRSIDIYQNWPAFFALNAWLGTVSGVPAIDVARWAQPFFELANLGAVLFAVRGVTSDARLQWSAGWLFLVGNWIGQDYLAPQAFGFVVSLVVIGIVIRCAPPGRPRWGPMRRLARDDDAAHPLAPLSGRAAVLVGGVCFLAVVLSHQLSPLFVIATVAALIVTTGRPPLCVLAALVAIEAWWVWRGLDFLTAHFDLLDVGQTASARPSAGAALPGAALGANASRAVIVAIALLAVAGAVRRFRGGHRDVIPATLALAPFVVAAVQSYDGEGPLRAYLFALPWLAFFAAAGCGPGRVAVGALRRGWRLLLVTVVVGSGSLLGYFGQDLVTAMSRSDVDASRWLLDNAPAGSNVTLVAPNFPDRLNARYVRRLDAPRALTDDRGFRGRPDPARIRAVLGAEDAAQRFLVLSPSQERYARFYGLLPQSAFDRLARALLSSRHFRLVHRDGRAQVFVLMDHQP
jgi:hypothetical protein